MACRREIEKGAEGADGWPGRAVGVVEGEAGAMGGQARFRFLKNGSCISEAALDCRRRLKKSA